MRKFIVLLATSLMIVGCSTQKNEQPAVETASEIVAEPMQGALPVIPGEEPKNSQAVELPFSLEMTGKTEGDETHVTLTIEYKTSFTVAPVLRLTPKGDTEIVAMRHEQPLDPPSAPGKFTKTIRLKGSEPGVEASVSIVDRGFGVEVHESWPPKRQPHEAAPVEIMEPLPAPIVVDGIEIDRGVRVKPE